MTSYATFLCAQSEEYQETHTKLKEVKLALEHQQNIDISRIIPKQYQPKQLKSFDTSLTKDFIQEYETLFFKQLRKVITNNTIKTKLFESRLNSIVAETEQHLSTLELPPKEMYAIHKKFLSDNQIINHTPIPCPQSKIQLAEEAICTQPTQSHPKRKRIRPNLKRKTTAPHLASVKHRKPYHLSQGHQNQLTQS